MAAAADGSPWSVACAGLGAAGRRAFEGLRARPPVASHGPAAVCLGAVCMEKCCMSMFAELGAVCCDGAAAARVFGGVSPGVRDQECVLAGFMRVRRGAVQRVRLAVGRVVGRVCRARGHGERRGGFFYLILSTYGRYTAIQKLASTVRYTA